MKRCLLLLFLPFLILTACNTGRQALKLIEKNKYEEARSKLNKAVIKDSLNADLYYINSRIFSDTAFSGYNIDSSYYFILKAQEDYEVSDLKTREKQQNQLGLDSLLLLEQKQLNDSLAYSRASTIHSVHAYQSFLDKHPGAQQTQKATRNRNFLAYQAASQLDSYEAYREFMETYPNAEEYELAKERYNILVFDVKTRSGDLQSYIDFLEVFPDSPFRPQAERQILEIITATNRFEDYEYFIEQYPKSQHTSLAVNLLYHLYQDRFSAQSFFQKYENFPFLDSLKKTYELNQKILAPIYEEGHYGLMDSQGNYSIPPNYDFIPAAYLCEGVEEAIVHLAKSSDRKVSHKLLTKAEEVIYEFVLPADQGRPDFRMERPYLYSLGVGILLVRSQDQGYTVLQESGVQLLPNAEMTSSLDTAALLFSQKIGNTSDEQPSYQFIKYQEDGLWGLSTFTGRILLKPLYEEIESLEDFILLRKNGKLAITKVDLVAAVADQRPIELSFLYDDASLLDKNHIIAYTDEYESAIDRNLNISVPLDRHNIIRKIAGSGQESSRWLLREDRVEAYVKNDSLLNRTLFVYYLYDKNEERNKTKTYRYASFNDNWLTLRDKEGFHIYNLQKNVAPQVYDSVKLLGENFALLFNYFEEGKDSVSVLFPNERKLALASPEDISFLLMKPSGKTTKREYLLIAPRSGPKEVWNKYGRRILMERFDDLKVYGPGLFVIEKNRRVGLLDSLGNELLPIKYDGISNYKDSLIAVFQNRKFGGYNYASGTLISTQYDGALQAYGSVVFHPKDSTSSRVYIVRDDGKYGLINNDEEALSATEFEQVRYWNDTSALVRKDGKWSIFLITRQTPYDEKEDYELYDQISEFELLESTADESLYRIYKDGGYGIMSNQRGELLTPTYDDIRLLGSISDPNSIFLAEKYVPEAQLYIMIHINTSGNIIKRQALTSEQYDLVFCDN